jgi:hypothetical protein
MFTESEEHFMTFDYDQVPVLRVEQLLQQASARTGFTPAEIVALIDCELNTDHLLEYITAVVSQRMN